MNVAERFSLYIQEKEEIELRPVFTIDGVTFLYVKVAYILFFVIRLPLSNLFCHRFNNSHSSVPFDLSYYWN